MSPFNLNFCSFCIFQFLFSIFLKALLCCPFHMPKTNCRYYANKGSLLGFPVITIIRFYSKLLSSELRMMILVMTGWLQDTGCVSISLIFFFFPFFVWRQFKCYSLKLKVNGPTNVRGWRLELSYQIITLIWTYISIFQYTSFISIRR